MAKFKLPPLPTPPPQTPPPQTPPDNSPQAGAPGLPAHLQRSRVFYDPAATPEYNAQMNAFRKDPVNNRLPPGGLFGPGSGLEVEAQLVRQARQAPPPPQPSEWSPSAVGGRIAEGFGSLYHGGVAGLASSARAIRAPFYTTKKSDYPFDRGNAFIPMLQPAGRSSLAAPTNEDPTVVDDPAGGILDAIAERHRAQVAAAKDPVARFAGQAVEIGTGIAPYLNPILGAYSGAGTAMLENKSGLGVGLGAALGGLPVAGIGRLASGLSSLTRAPSVVSHGLAGGAYGAGMTALTAGETALFEQGRPGVDPELAQRELGGMGVSAGAMGGLGMAMAAFTGGRAAFRTPPRPGQRPEMQVAPEVEMQVVPEVEIARRPDITPEMRASTVSADPVLTGPDGRPALPDIVRKDFVATPKARTAVDNRPAELPVVDEGAGGIREEFSAAPEARTAVDNRPAEMPVVDEEFVATPKARAAKGKRPIELPDIAEGAGGIQGEFSATPKAMAAKGKRPIELPDIAEGAGGIQGEFSATPKAMAAKGKRRVELPVLDEGAGGIRGEFSAAPQQRPAIRPDNRPAELPVVDEGGGGLRDGLVAPPQREGFYRAAPRRADIQPQPSDPTSLGEVPIRDPLAEYKAAGVEPNARTQTGSDLSPVEVPDAYSLPKPRPNGARMEMARSEGTPGDPYAETFRRSQARPEDFEGAPATRAMDEPLDQFTPAQIEELRRTSGTQTEVQLSPVEARADLETADFGSPDIAPEYRSPTTQVDVKIRPGARALSSEAQQFVKGLKPGERAMIQDSIEYLAKNPDPGGDVGNLQFALQAAKAKRERANRPKGSPPVEGGLAPLRSSRAEGNLVQGGFRKRGEPVPEPVDAEAETHQDLPPVAGANNARRGAALNPADVLVKIGEKMVESGKALYHLGKLPSSAGKHVLDVWSKQMWKSVHDLPGGQPLGAKMRSTISRAAELQGKLEPERQRALKSVSGLSKKARALRSSLAEVNWIPGEDVGYSRGHDVLNGKRPPRPLEAQFRNGYARLYKVVGQLAVNAKMMIRDRNGVLRLFSLQPGIKALRVGTDALNYYTSRPGDPETFRLAKAIAKENPGMTPESILRELKMWGERGITKRGLAEDARTIENFPTHYRDSEGRIIQLLEEDPQKLIATMASRFPQRVAYVEHFSQGSVPKEMQTIIDMHGEQAGGAIAENAFRALNGMALDGGLDSFGRGVAMPKPGSGMDIAKRVAEIPFALYRSLKLSTAPLSNIPETLGPARAITRSSPLQMAKSALAVMRDKNSVLDDLANRGAYTRSFLDWYWNPNNKAESVKRILNNTGGAINHAVNEFNEALAAHMSKTWVGHLKKGKGGEMDRFNLSLLEYSPSQIKSIVDGRATEAGYNDVIRRATAWAQRSTLQPAENSRAGNSPTWKALTIADRFSQAAMNRHLSTLGKMAAVVFDHGTSWSAKTAAVAKTLDIAGGALAASAITMAMRATFVGGAVALAAKATGTWEGFRDFMTDAAAMAFLTGPTQAVANSFAQDDKTLAETLTSPLIGLSLLQELKDAAKSEGQYEGMSVMESSTRFLRRSTAASPIIANAMGLVGLMENDPGMDAAFRQFFLWRKSYAPADNKTVSGTEDPQHFRATMRKATEALKAGQDPSEAIDAALSIKGKKDIASSLRSRKILGEWTIRKTDSAVKKAEKQDTLDRLHDYLGEDTMVHLQRYDALLESWASQVSPKKAGFE